MTQNRGGGLNDSAAPSGQLQMLFHGPTILVLSMAANSQLRVSGPFFQHYNSKNGRTNPGSLRPGPVR